MIRHIWSVDKLPPRPMTSETYLSHSIIITILSIADTHLAHATAVIPSAPANISSILISECDTVVDLAAAKDSKHFKASQAQPLKKLVYTAGNQPSAANNYTNW